MANQVEEPRPRADIPEQALTGAVRIGSLRVSQRTASAFSTVVAALFTAVAVYLYGGDARESFQKDLLPIDDITFFIAAGRLITSEDRTLLYDLPDGYTLRSAPAEWQRRHGYVFPILYPYPPIIAYAAAPLRSLDLQTAADLWRVGVALSMATLAACLASAFRSWAWRVAMVAAVLLWHPLLLNARIGQTGAFVAAILAVGALIYLRRAATGAILLALIATKPTAAIGPFLIAIQERPGVWLRFGLTAAALILLPFAALGPDSFFNWLDVLEHRFVGDIGGGHPYNQGLSSVIGSSTYAGLLIALLALIVVAYLVGVVQSRSGLSTAMAFAVLTGALVNPHSLIYDWGLAFVAVMLLRKAGALPPSIADLAFGVLAITLFATGQLTWATRRDEILPIQPLTLWAVIVCGAILLLTLYRYLRPPRPLEPASPPAAQTA